MGQSLKFTMWVILCLLLLGCVYDVKQASRYKEEVKNALDLSTKAATLQVNEDPTKIAQGIFEIDPVASKAVFEEYLSENLECVSGDLNVYVLDHEALNVHTSTNYINPATGTIKVIDRPTFVAVMKFKYKGIFISKEITIDNLAGTRMTSPNN